MAITFATRALRQAWTMFGGKRARLTSVTLDASYVNGTGYAITRAQLGSADFSTIDFVQVQQPHIGFFFSVSITATGIVLRAWKTGAVVSTAFAEAANNEAGLNGVVVPLL